MQLPPFQQTVHHWSRVQEFVIENWKKRLPTLSWSLSMSALGFTWPQTSTVSMWIGTSGCIMRLIIVEINVKNQPLLKTHLQVKVYCKIFCSLVLKCLLSTLKLELPHHAIGVPRHWSTEICLDLAVLSSKGPVRSSGHKAAISRGSSTDGFDGMIA